MASELLRLSTAGSVDDGKSTLIGRLLYDSKGVYEDQLASVQKLTVNQTAGKLDLSLLTDGLRAEREQGITIDVAYRYFATAKRKFIIADTPGHEQYTRNMATGASTAGLTIILIDARNGVLPQSRRHAFIASLLGIPHVVVAINKMDLMDYREDIFRTISDEFGKFARKLGLRNLYFVPISALEGDNVVTASERMPWFHGEPLLSYLESVPAAADRNLNDMRFPVQYVIRPNLDFRGYAGQVASGVIRVGEEVTVLPSGHTTRVKSIVTFDGNLEEAKAGQSVTVCLEDEVDVSRGEMLVHPGALPHVSRRFAASVVWMNQAPLEPGKDYIAKHTTQQVRATVQAIRHRVDINTLEWHPAPRLQLNEIGVVTLETNRPLFFDSYRRNRTTGAFILIDPITNETVGAGMIEEAVTSATRRTAVSLEEFTEAHVTPAERQARHGHRARAVWAGRDEELAYGLERKLFDQGCAVAVTDSDATVIQALLQAGCIVICLGDVPPSDIDVIAPSELEELGFSEGEGI